MQATLSCLVFQYRYLSCLCHTQRLMPLIALKDLCVLQTVSKHAHWFSNHLVVCICPLVICKELLPLMYLKSARATEVW